MNYIGDGDRLTGRCGEMRRHALQQHEWMVVDEDDLPARTGEARRLGVELAEVGDVAGDKGGDGEIIPLPDQPGRGGVGTDQSIVDPLGGGAFEHRRRGVDPIDTLYSARF